MTLRQEFGPQGFAVKELARDRRELGRVGLGWLEHPFAFGALVPILALLGAGATLLAPILLDPSAYGAFALLTTLFQYANAADLGLSQLADRRIAAQGRPDGDMILRARWTLAAIVIALGCPAAAAFGQVSGAFSPVAAALAVLAGAAFMVGNGPVSVYRASSRIGRFTLSAALLQFGMTLPRLAGLFLAGVTGCFAAMAAYYAAVALMFGRPRRVSNPSNLLAPNLPSLLAESLPLFAFNGMWLVYGSASRLLSSLLSRDQAAFGLFAFGASFVMVGAGVVGNISQVRYPRIVALLAASPAAAEKHVVADVTRLAFAAAGAAAIAAPFAATAIFHVFPRFEGAAPSTIALAISGVPIAVVAWTLPISISRSRRPWRDAIAIFGPSLLLLALAMTLGEKLAGLEGQAWGATASACALAALQGGMLRRAGALSGRGALYCALLPSLLVALFCAGVAVSRAQQNTAYDRPPRDALAFEDDFHALRLWDRSGGLWSPAFPWGGRTIPTSREREFYVDPRIDPKPLAEPSPFATDGGGLRISARRLPEAVRNGAGGLPYASGQINSARSFSQTYGYFEIRARPPRGRGLWPAFWLAPADGSWPPEIDVFEAHGDRLGGYFATIHFRSGDKNLETSFRIATPDLADDFHDYGVEWGPQRIRWTFDDRVVAETPTPPTMHKPMYMILNLAVGGKWPGDPDQQTVFPASFTVQRVLAYRLPASGKETSK